MAVREGYRQTEVGIIPEDWELFSLGQVTEYIKGFAFKADDYRTHGIRILRVSDTTYDGIKGGEGIYLDAAKASSFKKWALKEGDLVISTVGSKPPMYDSMVGKATYIQENDSGALLNQNAVILRSRQWSVALQRLLHNHLRQERYLSHIEKIFRGNANQASITLRDLFEYQIPLPPSLAEQQAIAEALSDVDGLISAVDALIAKKRAIKQGAMQELLTGQRRLSGFAGAWEVKTLGEIGYKFLNGGTPSTQKEEYWQGEIPWITGADVVNQTISEIRRCITEEAVQNSATNVVEKGNLLIVTRTGVGKLAIAPFDLAISQDLTGVYVKSDLAIAEYLYRFFDYNADKLKNLNQGTSIAGITRETLTAMKVSLPPLAEQSAIAQILADMDAEIAALVEKRDKTVALKQGMMQELLTGAVRLG